MRIALDCRMADWSGVGRYTRGLTRALVRGGGVELVQVLKAGAVPPVDAEVLVAESHPFSVAGMLELAKAFERSRADVIHCVHFPTPLRATAPLVVTIHDLIPVRVPQSMPGLVKRVTYHALVSRAVRMADAVVTPSVHTARDVASRWPSARPKTHPIPLAADDFTQGPLGQLPGGLSGRRYLLAMANPKPHKGLSVLVDAFQRLSECFPDVLLVLVGEGGPDTHSTVLASGARARVRFTGRIEDDVLRALYAGAEAFVFPSLYEGFGLPPLEAMSLGVPVITTSAASLPEVVGDAALVCPPGEARALASSLCALLGDGAMRASLVARGRERAACFSWEQTAKMTKAVYENLLDS